MSLRILAVYRHYWPDTTPYAAILREILERLCQDGHRVVVLAAQPTYNDVPQETRPRRENLGGVDVHRVWLLPERKEWSFRRLINSLLFAAQAVIFSLRAGKLDLIIGSTTPAVIMGYTLWLLKLLTGTQYIYHGQDLHPEAAVLAGKIRSRLAPAVLRAIERQTCRAAWCNVVLSEDMRKTVQSRSVPAHKIHVINNFAGPSKCPPSQVEWPFNDSNSGAFRLLFAGNLGSFQALEVLIDAAHVLCAAADIQFHFLGTGECMTRLRQRATTLLGKSVHFVGRQPPDAAVTYMSQADLGIISLARGMHRVSYPSKLMAYLAAGLPVLAIVEPASDLAHVVRDHRIGYVPRTATPECVAETIWDAYRQIRSGQGPSRAHVRRVSDRLFDRTRTLDQWTGLIRRYEAFQANPLPVRLTSATSFVN